MTNNQLKMIAVITMIIDHFGYYFSDVLNQDTYIILRIIGRTAMPIFTFLIIEGYFHTHHLKRYVLRIGMVACITQIAFFVIEILWKEQSLEIFKTWNILFSFMNLLMGIRLLDLAIQKRNMRWKMIFLSYVVVMVTLYWHQKFDYGFSLVFLGFSMYLTKRITKNPYWYKGGVCLAIFLFSLVERGIYVFASLSILVILFYNGKLGKKSAWMKWFFYGIFPIQHILLYIISILF